MPGLLLMALPALQPIHPESGRLLGSAIELAEMQQDGRQHQQIEQGRRGEAADDNGGHRPFDFASGLTGRPTMRLRAGKTADDCGMSTPFCAEAIAGLQGLRPLLRSHPAGIDGVSNVEKLTSGEIL